MDESWHDQEDPPQDVERVSSTSVEQPHAVTSSIEETHASKPHAQSILMNYFSERVHPERQKEVEWFFLPAIMS